jgi:3-phenylpropionate/trans-cinnamate dioxygenase ferredoxin component
VRVRVARLDEVVAGEPKLVDVDGTPIVLARVGDRVHACGAVCAHHQGPLDQGRLSGARLTCPWHGWMFDVRTGVCLMPSRGAPIPTYRVELEAGDVWIEVAGADPVAPPAAASTGSDG